MCLCAPLQIGNSIGASGGQCSGKIGPKSLKAAARHFSHDRIAVSEMPIWCSGAHADGAGQLGDSKACEPTLGN